MLYLIFDFKDRYLRVEGNVIRSNLWKIVNNWKKTTKREMRNLKKQ